MKTNSKHTYIIYNVDGTKETIERNRPLSLHHIQDIVDGFVDTFSDKDRVFFMNEEAILIGLPKNPFFEHFKVQGYSGIRGTVIEGRLDEKGKFIGIEEKES